MSKYFALSLAVLLIAAGQGADAAIRVTRCIGPANLSRATCSGNCSSFVVNEGQCFGTLGPDFDTVRCLLRAKCADIEQFQGTTCAPGGTERAQFPCGVCQNNGILKCTDAGATFMNCSDSQCQSCQPVIGGNIGQCVSMQPMGQNNSFKINAINSCKLFNRTQFYQHPCISWNVIDFNVDISGSCASLYQTPSLSVSTRYSCVTGRLTEGQSNLNQAAHVAFMKEHGLDAAVVSKTSTPMTKFFFGN